MTSPKAREAAFKEPERLINEHIGFAMVAGAIPIPIVNIAAVTAIQLDLLNNLSKYHKVDFNSERGKSIVSTILTSSIGISVVRIGASAVKGIPGLGTILAIGSQVIFSGASTFAIGHIFNDHFSAHGTLLTFSFEKVKQDFQDLFEKDKDFAKETQKKQSKEDILTTIEKLNDLKKTGAITKEEFEKAKNELLSKL